MAWRYHEFFLELKTIFYSLGVLVREISFLSLELKFISSRPHVIASIYGAIRLITTQQTVRARSLFKCFKSFKFFFSRDAMDSNMI